MRKITIIFCVFLSCLFYSCIDRDVYTWTKQDMFESSFERYIGGKVNPNQNWGFYDITIAGDLTRGLVPEIDDPFEEFENIKYLDTLPDNVDIQVANNSTPWWEYANKNGHFEFKDGTYNVGCWNSAPDCTLTFYITGKATITTQGLHSACIYVLPGAELTLNQTDLIHNFKIFVSDNAVLNYTRDEIETQGYWDSVKGENTRTVAAIFNRGTLNFTGDKCDIRNGAVVYNENIMKAKEINCNSQDGLHSYLYNYGDVYTTEGDFVLNGASNFYNEGLIEIEGNTTFTNAGSHWINKGHYHTKGDMEFMGGHGNYETQDSKDNGAYNFCQLLVDGTFIFKDGTFVLLDNSYIEAAKADFRNFRVEMWGHAGINIKEGSVFEANADSDRQGFHGRAESASYLRLGGTTVLPDNSNSFNLTGKIVYGIEDLEDNSEGTVNQAINIGEDVVEVPFINLTSTLIENECYVVWTPTYDTVRVIVEDLPATIESLDVNMSDFDYNDVVFDATFKETTIDITIHACGGTMPLYVAGKEVHGLFGLPTTKIMTNNNHSESEPVTFTIDRNGINNANDIPVWVEYNGERYYIETFTGKAPAKICVGTDYVWCDERLNIKKAYPKFVEWAKGNPADWENNSWYK